MGSGAVRAREFIVVCLMAAIYASAANASESTAPDANRRWNVRTIQLSLSRSLFRPSSAIKTGSQVRNAIEAAAASWSDSAAISFRFAESELESVSDARSNGDGRNLVTVAATAENIALFPKEADSPPAFTRLFFTRLGSITEADIVLNPFVQFSTDGTTGTFDLGSVIAHELGHVIGLGHSPAMGATMYGRISQIRDASGPAARRALADTDVSMARALYGPSDASVDCCVYVTGGLAGKGAAVWVEESSTGRVVAADVFSGDRYSLGGFMRGKYRVLAQPMDSGPAVRITERELDLPTRLKAPAFGSALNAQIKFLGLNGELGSVPIRLSRGRNHHIFLGGAGLDPETVSFGFSTPAIAVMGGATAPIHFGRGISAVALTVSVDQAVAEGIYSVFVESPDGMRRYMIGAVEID